MIMTNSIDEAHDDHIANLVFEPTSLWRNQNVTLAFVNGDEKQHLHFRRIYFQWFLSTHIHFREIPLSHGADIRVGFGLDKHSSWSLIGSTSAFFSYNITSGKTFRDYQKIYPSLVVAYNSEREILHEGGHSVSLTHEHFHPLANISWKKSFMDGSMYPDWEIKNIKKNYIRRLPLNQSLGRFDE
jgi:hypothetical protein